MKSAALAGIILAACGLTNAASAQDWEGFYAGVAAVTGESSVDFQGLPAPFTSQDTASLGFYAGYDHRLASNLVLGGELSYTDIDTSEFPPTSIYYGQGLLQARARIGLASGKAMPYVTFGFAKTHVGILSGPSTPETGKSLGVGVEFMVGTNMSVRAEFDQATFKDVESTFVPPGTDLDYQTISIGTAWRF